MKKEIKVLIKSGREVTYETILRFLMAQKTKDGKNYLSKLGFKKGEEEAGFIT